MARLKLLVAYDGGAYAGWQIQAEGRGKSTIQKELEAAVASIAGVSARVHGSGRTDSGVHAEGQVAHVDVPDMDVDWARALNSRLPHDVRVLSAVSVPQDFHARFSATGKIYAYCLFEGAGPVPPRLAPYAWATPALDEAAMRKTAAMLVGARDFASFQNAGTPVADTVRTIWSVTREDFRAGPFLCPDSWPVSSWIFHGNGFLKQMVRNLMGLLVWVGSGKISPDDVPQMFDGRDRRAVPSPAAPAKGLSLVRVEYPDEFSLL